MTTPVVGASEVLYRQIGDGGNPIFFDPNRESPVNSAIFLPARPDTDGLSLILRRSFGPASGTLIARSGPKFVIASRSLLLRFVRPRI